MPLDRGAPDRAAHTGGRQRSGVAPADRRALALGARSVTGDARGGGGPGARARRHGARTAPAKDAQDGARQAIVRQDTTGEDV